MSNHDYDAGLVIWTVAEKYLNMVEAVAQQIVASGNLSGVVSTQPISTKEFDARTKWSDTNLSLPLFFNFYHGLETTMKGFLAAKKVSVGRQHNLSNLLNEVNRVHPGEPVFNLMSNYIEMERLPSPLKEFFEGNDITPDLFYQALKYSDVQIKRKKIEVSHLRLKYGGSGTTNFYDQIATDANEIRRLPVSLSRSLESEPV